MVGFVRTFYSDADVGSLISRQGRQLRAQLLQMQACDLLVQMLGQHEHLAAFVCFVAREQLDLSNRLVG